jgi:hypothetical protein
VHKSLLASLAGSALLAAQLAPVASAHNTYPGAHPSTPGDAPYAQLALAFEPNLGQMPDAIDFVARGRGYSIGVSPTTAVLGLGDAEVHMQVVGAQAQPPLATDELDGKVNYLLGSDPAGWRTDVPTFGHVSYQDVYPGIDLTYYGAQQRLEYDFTLQPGASASTIALSFDGVGSLLVDGDGDLLMRTPSGDVRQPRPVAPADHRSDAGILHVPGWQR